MNGREAVRGCAAGANVPPDSPLSGLRTLRVGSRKAPKLEAVRRAFEPYTRKLEILGVEVDSGVSEQPVGFEEIIRGARNRARGAQRSGSCELAVGIEDGLVKIPGMGADVLNVGAACVCDERRESLGLSSGFAYPVECLGPALTRREPIGALFDRLWRRRARAARGLALSDGAGNIGRLTLGVLPRAEYGYQAVLCALVRFLHPELYFEATSMPGTGDSPPAGGAA